MISVAHGMRYRKGEIIFFTGTEKIPCPVCGGQLRVHGTCTRKLRRSEGIDVYRLRVMECKTCGKTHRELPEEIVPYKRMDTELLSNISEVSKEEDLGDIEVSTWKRVREWVLWFLAYALDVLRSLQTLLGKVFQTISSGECLSRRLAYFVRLVANSGNWIQHRSEMKSGLRPAIMGVTKDEGGLSNGNERPKEGRGDR